MIQKPVSRLYWMPLIVLLLGIASGAVFFWLSHLSDLQRRSHTLFDAIHEIEREVSLFHLWLDEHAADADSVDNARAWQRLEHTFCHANALLEQLDDDALARFGLSGPANLRADAGELKAMLIGLNDIAQLRYQSLANGGDEQLPEEFNVAFQAFIDRADRLEEGLERHTFDTMSLSLVLFRVVLAGWTVAIIGLTFALWQVERRRLGTARALASSEERFRAMSASARDAIVMLGDGGSIVYWNRAAERLFGYRSDAMLGRNFFEVLTPVHDDGFTPVRPEELDGDEASGDSGTVGEFVVRTGLGRGLAVEVSAAPILLHGERQVVAIMRDITARKEAEDALRDSEALLNTLIDSMPDIVCFKDGQGRWLKANVFDLRLFGIDGVDYHGKKDSELADSSGFYRQVFLAGEESDEVAWRSGRAFRQDEVIPRPNGSSLVFDVIKVPLFDEAGNRKGLVVIGRDITARKEAEEELYASEARYKTLAEVAPVGIFQEDAAGRCTYVNRQWTEITGLTLEQTAGRGWLSAVHPDDRYRVAAEWHEAMASGELFQAEFRFLLANGNFTWVVSQAVALRDHRDRVTDRLGTVTDITPRKRVEEQLLLFRNLINQSNDIIFVSDPETGRLLDVNDNACDILGYRREELLNRRCLDIVNPEQPPVSWEEHVARVRASGNIILEGTYRRRDGSLLPVEININHTRRGSREYLVSFARDITERKRAEEALRSSEERLRQLSSSLFTVQENERRRIAVELHDELGQALAALKLQVRSVERRLPAAQEGLRRECDGICNYINQVIENVRRLSRDLSPVMLEDLGFEVAIKHLVNNFSTLYNIKTELRVTAINHLLSDEAERSIYRILQEALNNIGKHAGADSLAVVIERDRTTLRFTIRDNGRGFDVDEALHRRGERRGMGLTAMAERVRMLGGTFDIRSRPGEGTVISLTVPIVSATARTEVA